MYERRSPQAGAALVVALLLGLSAVALLGGPSRAERKRAPRPERAPSGAEVLRARPTAPSRAKVWARPKARYVAVGRLDIPSIDLSTPFFLGVHDDVVELGPGLWPGTPLPGAPGNAVLAGHRTTFTHPFEDLDLLRRGDVVRTHLEGGRKTVFRVRRTTIVPEERYADFVLRPPERDGARLITMFACTPKGSRTHRIVVQARAVT
ncbi:MAG: class E sortase [Actinomycetota bacterium]